MATIQTVQHPKPTIIKSSRQKINHKVNTLFFQHSNDQLVQKVHVIEGLLSIDISG